MKIQAYPTDSVTPVDAAGAHRIADWYLYSRHAQERGDVISIREFDHCFTVVMCPAPPHPGDAATTAWPREAGGGVSVIDKQSGHVSFWPNWSQNTVAARYVAAIQAGEIEHQPSWPKAGLGPED